MESNGNFLSAVQHRNGGYYLEFVVGGVCSSVLQTQTLFETKIRNFPFSVLFSKIHTIFTFVLLNPYPCYELYRLSNRQTCFRESWGQTPDSKYKMSDDRSEISDFILFHRNVPFW